MKDSTEAMTTALRVLTAVTEKRNPERADVETLKKLAGHNGPANLDELACEVIQKALHQRAKEREKRAD